MTSSRLAAVTATAVVALGGFAAIASGKPASKGKADSGTSYVSIVTHRGKTEYAAGYSFDKLLGHTAVTYNATIAAGKTGTIDVTAKPVTEYTPTGSLYGSVTAVENLATGAVTDGKLKLTRGTGGQKGHSFIATITGNYDAKSGIFTFHYKGIYR
jgi:hypothetical protein